MKALLGAGIGIALLALAAHARGSDDPLPAPAAPPADPPMQWSEWGRSIAGRPRAAPSASPEPASDLDVVDAHWMALTMWGEARGQGEAAMRAVGHVIANRRRIDRHGAFVTDTVSEAWQFSCWNPGDPNRAAIDSVDRLAPGSREQLLWRAARHIADDILAGRSDDPTGGALFYHSVDVAPVWSRGARPVALIGGHLFFREAARRG